MFGKSKQQQTHIDHLQRKVRRLETLVDTLAQRADVGAAELAQLRADVEPGITDQIRDLVAQGKNIEAIKEYRTETGAGLKDAKDAIDEYQARGR